jgi:uncharacterized protein (TIGR02246 family)
MTVEVSTTSAPAAPSRAGSGLMKQAALDVAAKLELAWNRGSADAFAALFSDRADVIAVNGGMLSGRAAIEEAFRKAFAGGWARSRANFRLLKIKPLDETVVMDLLGQRLTLMEGDSQREVAIRATAVLRELRGEWKIVLLQSTGVSQTVTAEGEGDAPAKKGRKPA